MACRVDLDDSVIIKLIQQYAISFHLLYFVLLSSSNQKYEALAIVQDQVLKS